MNKWLRLFLIVLIVAGVVAVFVGLTRGSTFAVLSPKGTIGAQQRNLLFLATGLMALIVVPVLALTFGIAWRFRAGNTKATYRPDWDGNAVLETIWWGFPCVIILVLAGIIWRSSHALDPAKALASSKPPLVIQVVALPWKWLFIYPGQNIATVNYVQFPADTPIRFQLTSDAPMNSFWIPQLGGQIYTMTGMSTELNLMADAPGSFSGVSANLSGKGFAGMRFVAKATSQADFDQWVATVSQSRNTLDRATYDKLALPSENVEPQYYAGTASGLFEGIIARYIYPQAPSPKKAAVTMPMPMPTMTPRLASPTPTPTQTPVATLTPTPTPSKIPVRIQR